MKISTFIAISKDGFIATKDGDISFLNNLNIKGDGGYEKYYNTIDALIYGSKTYLKIKSFDTFEWPYSGKTSYVLTTQKFDHQKDVVFKNQNVKDLANELSKIHDHIWVMGGANVINQFIDENLLDELHISKANVSIKDGIKLFQNENILDKYEVKDTIDYGDISTTIYIKK